MEHKILYLSPKDVKELGVNDMKEAMNDVEQTYLLIGKGDALTPTKVAMEWPEETYGPQNRINAMPGYLGGSINMAGVKWIGSNVDNPKSGLPRASALVILNDPVTKLPVCVMDSTRVSAMRTGAAGGMGIKYLAKKDASTLLMIGAGVIGRAQVEAACCARDIKRIFVNDVFPEKAKSFAEALTRDLGISAEATTEPEKAVHEADIVITATVTTEPIVKEDWIHPGLTYIHIGGPECTIGVMKMADKIFTDDLEGIIHRGLTSLGEAIIHGQISREETSGDLHQVMLGNIPGRDNDEQFIFFGSVGIGSTDIAISTRIYRKALAEGRGTWLPYEIG
ncbi:MAG: ornithine cyclodeaminase family protein [Lachnospiraceae bacterium]|nr:ornithine cyclodeaminase family protein [Lachnospiraceae bacterium]